VRNGFDMLAVSESPEAHLLGVAHNQMRVAFGIYELLSDGHGEAYHHSNNRKLDHFLKSSLIVSKIINTL